MASIWRKCACGSPTIRGTSGCILMLAGWWRVHPEMNLVGRAGYAGDELGSSLVASEMVSGLMHLSFLIERRYAPDAKWFGPAFSELQIANPLAPLLDEVLRARTWRQREKALGSGYEVVADAFNDLEIAPRLTLEPVRMWERPFTVMWADFPGALSILISDSRVRDLVERWPTGGIDQVRDILWARLSGGPRFANLRSSRSRRRGGWNQSWSGPEVSRCSRSSPMLIATTSNRQDLMSLERRRSRAWMPCQDSGPLSPL